jgi:methylphosphotriester-DNA--protein-cysteine methyltransferase
LRRQDETIFRSAKRCKPLGRLQQRQNDAEHHQRSQHANNAKADETVSSVIAAQLTVPFNGNAD